MGGGNKYAVIIGYTLLTLLEMVAVRAFMGDGKACEITGGNLVTFIFLVLIMACFEHENKDTK